MEAGSGRDTQGAVREDIGRAVAWLVFDAAHDVHRSRGRRRQDAAFAGLPSKRVRPTCDLHHHLHRFLHAYVTTFDSPTLQAAVPGESDRPIVWASGCRQSSACVGGSVVVPAGVRPARSPRWRPASRSDGPDTSRRRRRVRTLSRPGWPRETALVTPGRHRKSRHRSAAPGGVTSRCSWCSPNR